MAVSFTKTDLSFILQQILMAENGQPPVNPHLSFGLRELAGTNNNQLPGQSTFGSSDQAFPTVAQEYFRTVTVNVDGTPFDPNPGIAGDTMTTTYASTDPNALGPNAFGVNVVDAAPRVISNLISDISTNNAAAVAAAQTFGAQLGDGYTAFNTNPAGLTMPGPDGVFGTPDDILPADPNSLFIGNIVPDAGLSAPFNNWMTFFGQFFDHGLDLISKGGSGLVYIPLAADDPLVTLGPDGKAGTGDEVPLNQAFMVLNRATNIAVSAGADGVMGTADDVHKNLNQTSPFVDQSQTYGSEGSHNAFLREYMIGIDGKLHSTGKMLQHTTGAGLDGIQGDNQATAVDESLDDVRSGMATWGDLKANALRFGLILQDKDVGNVPLLATDAYGNLLLDAAGHVQVMVQIGLTPTQVALNPLAPQTLDAIAAAAGPGASIMFTGHAFINDMAAAASPFDPQTGQLLLADTDTTTGLANSDATPIAGHYDNELLDAHYVAGDGRINENIALTTVHEVFHDEHNRLVDQTKALIQSELNSGDTGFATDWVLAGVDLTVANGVDALGNPVHIIQDNEWNGERLMQVAKFGTETQYQHLVFEEFARKVAPTIHLFGNVDIHLDPAITSEFANAVYRFGHSMLDDNVPLYKTSPDGTIATDNSPFLDALGNPSAVDTGNGANPNFGKPQLTDLGLLQAFTNPLAFAASPDIAGQIVQGTTHQIGSEIDEFVTNVLRNNLLGQPLDLAALNIARGRDVGVPPLNLVRAQIYDATHDQTLKPYDNWNEFGQFLKHPESLINFIAAYGTHASITGTTDLAQKRLAAAQLIQWGNDPASALLPVGDGHRDAYDFMHSLGAYANATHGAGADGQLHTSDDTFTMIDPITHLAVDDPIAVHAGWSTGSVTGVDNIDLWIGGLAEKQNLFGGLLGSTFNFIFETQLENLQDGDRLYYLPRIEGMDFSTQIENNSFAEMIQTNLGVKHLSAAVFMTPEYTVEASDYFVKDATQPDGFAHDAAGNRIATDPSTWLHNPVTGKQLVEVLPDGTVHFIGDDNFLGNTMVLGGTEGNDRLVAGMADDDTVWGDGGNDWMDGGNGNDNLFGGTGNDTIVDSAGDDVMHGDAGNDTMYGGIGADTMFGGDGNDLMDGGAGIDSMVGGLGNDIMFGAEDDDEIEGNAGDDYLFGGIGGDLLVGDVGAPTGQQPLYSGNDVLDGGAGGDVMKGFDGDDIMFGEGGFDKFQGRNGYDWATFEHETHGISTDMARREFVADPAAPAGDGIRDFYTGTEGVSGSKFDDVLQGDNENPAKIDLFNQLTNVNLIFGLSTFFAPGPVAYSQGNIMLGGAGNDMIEGRGGDDIIDGDAWLHVDLTRDANGNITPDSQIIREIRWDTSDNNVDTAVFNDVMANYTINLTPDAQGFITVTHNGSVTLIAGGVKAVVNEGADHIRNVERLQFADQTIVIDPSPNANAAPVGAIAFTAGDTNPAAAGVDPASGTPLTVLSNITDADGIQAGSVHFQWQYFDVGSKRYVDIAGATNVVDNHDGTFSSTFTPNDLYLATTLRVMETYTDGTGFQERAFSPATNNVLANAAVNTAPFVVPQIGTVGIADTNARTGFAVNVSLPLTTAFSDRETASNLLTYTAKIAGTNQPLDGSAAAHGLKFTLVPDPATPGAILGATITGTPTVAESIAITITATDPGGPGLLPPLSAQDTFLINVQTGNLAPVINATPESAAGLEDTLISGTLLGPQVPDPDGPSTPVWRVVQGSAANGTVAINGTNGAFVFKPAAGLSSNDLGGPPPTFSFQYRLFDGISFSAPKTVTITVASVDDGVAPMTITGTAAEGATLTALIGADPDGAWIGGTDHYQWTRDGAAIGTDSSNYVVTEADIGHTISVSATYTDAQGALDSTGDATNPTAVGELSVGGLDGVITQLVLTDTLTDPDFGVFPGTTSYSWELSTDGVNFTPVNPADVSPDGLNLTVAPTDVAGAYARVTATFIDGLGNLNTATKVVHYVVDGGTGNVIVGIGDSDVIYAGGGDDTITAGACNDFVDGGDGNDKIIATANDGNDVYIGGAGIDTLVMTGARSDYTVVENADGSFTVTDTRAVNGNGIDRISGIEIVQFTDGSVRADAPVGGADSYGTNEDTALNVANAANGVLANDSFILPIGATLNTNAAHGNVVLNADGTFTYTPNANYAGSDSFTYIAASSGAHASTPVTVSLTVNPVNDGPAVVSITGTAAQNQTLTASITTPDPDGAGTAPTFKWFRDGVEITGATASTYVLGSLDVGKHITAQAFYTDGQNFAESPTSAATALVTAAVALNVINGTAGNNTIAGTAAADLIHGLAGNDQITAGAGNDQVFGDDGNDTFFASVNDGNDTYDGGAGTDTYNMAATAGLSSVNLLLGTASSAQTGSDVLISIENVTGSSGDNVITGNDVANVLVGNGGNDILDGGSAGADTLRGGVGNDTYIVNHTGMTLTENAGQGTDTVQSSITFSLGNNFENLTLTGSGNIDGTGNAAANVIIGNSGNNALSGLGGNDTFVATVNDGNDSYNGGTGTDTYDLSGTSAAATVNLAAGTASSAQIGSDTLASIEKIIGGLGADMFTAGAGQETFTGGAGGDTFIFLTRQAAGTGAGGRTIITDFTQGSDKVDVSAIDAINGGGHDNFVFDAVAKAATGQVANGHLGYFHTTIGGVEHTIIEANIQGIAGAADFQIDLIGNYTLTHDDLLGLV